MLELKYNRSLNSRHTTLSRNQIGNLPSMEVKDNAQGVKDNAQEVKDNAQEPRKLLRLKSTRSLDSTTTTEENARDSIDLDATTDSDQSVDTQDTTSPSTTDAPRATTQSAFMKLVRNRSTIRSNEDLPTQNNTEVQQRTEDRLPRRPGTPYRNTAAHTIHTTTRTVSSATPTTRSTSFLSRIRAQRTASETYNPTQQPRVHNRPLSGSRTQQSTSNLRNRDTPSSMRIPQDVTGPQRFHTSIHKNRSVTNHEYRAITSQHFRPKRRVQHAHVPRIVNISESTSISSIALQTALKTHVLVNKLKKLGATVVADSMLDRDTAELVITELGHTAKYAPRFDTELKKLEDTDLAPRCPIVTIAGHVDHGKTTILDTIRKSKITDTEHGGITQSIGAYQVTHNGKQITFLDTPGHLAFSKMREHGIRVTDIALLIVAANDSVQEQTIESIRHIQAANTTMIVVINKIDAPNANPQKVLTDLLQHGIIDESMGGETMSVQISAKTGQNIDKLLDTILVQAELMELRAVHQGESRGVVLEASTIKGIGTCATVILNRGVLKVGEYFVAGASYGKVRSITDSTGKKLKTGHVSQPIRISGFESVPSAGDQFGTVASEREAKNLIQERTNKTNDAMQQVTHQTSIQDIFNKSKKATTVPFVINATSHGMLEAISSSIKSITHKHLQTEVVQTRVGAITAGDVEMAKTANAEILGFQVEAAPDAKSLIKQYGIKCTTHQIIYKAIEYVVDLLKQTALQEEMSRVSAEVEVVRVFDVKNVGCVVGCGVKSGSIEVGDIAAIQRKGNEIYRGLVDSIQQETERVKVAEMGGEYGIIIKSSAGNIYKNVSVGDGIKFYKPVVD